MQRAHSAYREDRPWIRVTFKRNVSTSSKKSDIVTKSELVIKTCSVNAAFVVKSHLPRLGRPHTALYVGACWARRESLHTGINQKI